MFDQDYLLHAHCVKFRQNPFSSLAGDALTSQHGQTLKSLIINLSKCQTKIISLHAPLCEVSKKPIQ